MYYRRFYLSLFILLLFITNDAVSQLTSQGTITLQSGQVLRQSVPINIGWIFSLPYDISNTLRTPLGGPLSIVLTAMLACSMFFGMIVSPVWYLFGAPQRPYHVHDAQMSTQQLILETVGGRKYPDFVSSAFFFMPEENVECQKLIVCHAHGFVGLLPNFLIRTGRFFSQKLMDIPDEFQSAITTGLTDNGHCKDKYACPKDLTSIVMNVLTRGTGSFLKFT